jgi:carbon monoxide dehydrogenase subunit G
MMPLELHFKRLSNVIVRMKKQKSAGELNLEGVHIVDLGREQLWESMHDPDILQRCIKGCEQVEKVSDEVFLAKFKVRIGPMKKVFDAHLSIQDINPSAQYSLVSAMDAGIAGKINGTANVQMVALEDQQTRLSYQAQVKINGLLGELGVTVLGAAAERYMQRFFEQIIEQLEDNR